MAPHRTGNGLRTLQAAGVLLAGVVLSSCGQPSGQTESVTASPNDQSAPVRQPSNGGGTADQPTTSHSSRGDAAADRPQSTSPRTPSEQPTPNAQQGSSGVDRCHTSMLSGNLTRGDPGAGQRYAELVLTNDSAETCTLYGYGGLQLVDSNGEPLATELERTPNPSPTRIELAPGETASKTLHWTVVPHGGEPTDGPCQPVPSGAEVIPPDETDPLFVEWGQGPVCGFGSIDGSAYYQ